MCDMSYRRVSFTCAELAKTRTKPKIIKLMLTATKIALISDNPHKKTCILFVFQ